MGIFGFMCTSLNLFRKTAVQNDAEVPPIFVTDTKIIFGYNFRAPAINTCISLCIARLYYMQVNYPFVFQQQIKNK